MGHTRRVTDDDERESPAPAPEEGRAGIRRVAGPARDALASVAAAAEPLVGRIGEAVEGVERSLGERPGMRIRRVRRQPRPRCRTSTSLSGGASGDPVQVGLRTIPVDEIAGTAVGGGDQRGGDFLPLRPFRGRNWAGRWQRLNRPGSSRSCRPSKSSSTAAGTGSSTVTTASRCALYTDNPRSTRRSSSSWRRGAQDRARGHARPDADRFAGPTDDRCRPTVEPGAGRRGARRPTRRLTSRDATSHRPVARPATVQRSCRSADPTAGRVGRRRSGPGARRSTARASVVSTRSSGAATSNPTTWVSWATHSTCRSSTSVATTTAAGRGRHPRRAPPRCRAGGRSTWAASRSSHWSGLVSTRHGRGTSSARGSMCSSRGDPPPSCPLDGRADLVVSHAPPRGVGDAATDPYHVGYAATAGSSTATARRSGFTATRPQPASLTGVTASGRRPSPTSPDRSSSNSSHQGIPSRAGVGRRLRARDDRPSVGSRSSSVGGRDRFYVSCSGHGRYAPTSTSGTSSTRGSASGVFGRRSASIVVVADRGTVALDHGDRHPAELPSRRRHVQRHAAWRCAGRLPRSGPRDGSSASRRST